MGAEMEATVGKDRLSGLEGISSAVLIEIQAESGGAAPSLRSQ